MGKGYVARVGMQYYVCIMYMGGGAWNTEKKSGMESCTVQGL